MSKKNTENEKQINFDLSEDEDFIKDQEMDDEQAVEKVSKLREFARNHKKGVIATIVITVITVAVAVIAPGLAGEDDSVNVDIDDETGTITISENKSTDAE